MGKAKQRYITALKKFQRTPETQRGTLGNSMGIVAVPNQPDMVYVTVAGIGVREVKNTKVANMPGAPVKIGYDPIEPNIFQVLGTVSYPQVYNAPQYTNAVATHAATHNWSGNDTVWIEKRQLMPLRITPIGAMNLFLSRDIFWSNDRWIYYGGATINMSAAVPSTGSRYALIYVGVTGSYGVLTGTVRDLQTMLFSDLPSPLPGTIPTAIIRLYAGQTGIAEGLNDTDIVDVRGLFSPVGSGGSSGVTGSVASGVVVDTTYFNHNLSAADNTVQKALETLDEITAGTGMTNPMTTLNDIIYGGVSGTAQRLGAGSNGKVLTLVSGTMNWETPASGTPVFHGCRFYRGSAQTISSLGNVGIVWDGTEFDTDSYLGLSGMYAQIPTGLAGYYHINLIVDFYDTDYTSANQDVMATIGTPSGTIYARTRGKTYMFGATAQTSTIIHLAEGDQIKAFAYNGTSINFDISYTGHYTHMELQLVGT